MKKRLRYAVLALLMMAFCWSIPGFALAADVSDNSSKPSDIEVNKVYTGKFEKKGDTDCFRFKSGGGSFKVLVWYVPGEPMPTDEWDTRAELSYGEYGKWSQAGGASATYALGVNGYHTNELLTPLNLFETEGTDYIIDGDYVRRTVSIGSYKKGKEAGIVFSSRYKGSYKFKVVGKKYVVVKSIKGAKVTVASPTYSGLALKPKVTVKLGSKTLKIGTDYTVSYSNNVKAGSKAVAKIKGKGSYKDTISKKFTIKKKSVANSVQIKLSNTSVSYSGKAKKPSFSIYLPAANSAGMVTMKNNVDYTYKYKDNVEPGTAKLIVTGKGNFTGTTTRKFTITKLKQPATLKASGTTVTYEKIGKTASIGFKNKKESAKATYSSSNTKVATVNKSGTVTFKGTGTATIKVQLAATKHYKASTLNYTVKVLKQQVITTGVKDGAKIAYTSQGVSLGAALKTGDGKLSFKSSDTSVIKVDSNGNLSFDGVKKLGTATITITAAKTGTYAAATKTVKITTVKAKPVLIYQSPQEHNRDEAPFSLGVTVNEPVALEYVSENENLVTVSADGIATINPDAITEDVSVGIRVKSKANTFYKESDAVVITLNIHTISLDDPSIYMKQDYGSSNCTLFACAHMMRRRAILDGRSDWNQVITRDDVQNEYSDLAQAVWVNGNGLSGEFHYVLSDGYSFDGYCVEVNGLSAEYLIQLLSEHPEGIEVYDTGVPHAVLVTHYDRNTGIFYCVDSDPGQGSDVFIPLADSLIGDNRYNSQDNVLANIGKYWYLA